MKGAPADAVHANAVAQPLIFALEMHHWAQLEAAVRAAVLEGKSGYMVKIVRVQSEPYKWTTDLQPLGDIANVEHGARDVDVAVAGDLLLDERQREQREN